MKKFVCALCGYAYDVNTGDPITVLNLKQNLWKSLPIGYALFVVHQRKILKKSRSKTTTFDAHFSL